jgi:hypothetical protein
MWLQSIATVGVVKRGTMASAIDLTVTNNVPMFQSNACICLFPSGLFNDAENSSDHIGSNELERIWK